MRKWAYGLAVAALLTSGCSSDMDKSGGERPAEVLILASNDGGGLRGVPAIELFVERVAELSGGDLEVRVQSEWQGGADEARVLTDVAKGEADLAWSGTRAMAALEVDDFRALHAPFLVGSYAAQAAVVDSDVAEDMLGSLEPAGVTGLALLADELRFPTSAGRPLREPGDLEGLDIGTVRSDVQEDAIVAMGAEALGVGLQRPPETDGLDAVETMWSTFVSNGQAEFAPYATANAYLWPRTTVLMANTERFEELDQDAQSVVQQAAAEARAWSVEHAADRLPKEIAQACLQGARIALASPAQLEAFRKAAERTAYDDIRAAAPERFAQVEELVAGLERPEPVNVPRDCAYREGEEEDRVLATPPDPLDGPGDQGELPAGTYRYSVTHDEVMSEGGMSDEGARANAGVWTWKIGGGRWEYLLEPSSDDVPDNYAGNFCEGYLDVDGDRVSFTTITFYADGDCAPPTWWATYDVTRDGLGWRVTADGIDLEFLFAGKPWDRID